MIRPAKAGDIMRLVELLKEAHPRSKYAGRATFNDKRLQKRLFNAILSHGAEHEGGSWCMVSEQRGVVEGLLFGLLNHIEDCADEMFATDWKFYVSPRAEPREALLLQDEFLRWARSTPGVIEVYVGVHDVINANFEKTGLLWARKGFRQTGGIWELALNGAERSVA